MKYCVGFINRAHALRSLRLVHRIIGPPIRMPRLRETFVSLLQLSGARSRPETDRCVGSCDRIDRMRHVVVYCRVTESSAIESPARINVTVITLTPTSPRNLIAFASRTSSGSFVIEMARGLASTRTERPLHDCRR